MKYTFSFDDVTQLVADELARRGVTGRLHIVWNVYRDIPVPGSSVPSTWLEVVATEVPPEEKK